MIAAVLALGLVAQQAPPITKSVDQQKALIAKIQAERAAKSGAAVPAARKVAAKPLSGLEADLVSPGDPPVPKAASSKKARYRAYQKRFEAEQAEIAKAERETAIRMAPIIAEQARQQQQTQMRMYETNLRHQENMDFNDALRGVTRGKP